MTVNHQFVAFPDGKRRGCVRCPWPQADHPAPTSVDRNLAGEAGVVAQAIAGTALDPSGLEAFAHSRAHPGPVRVKGRSLRREALEELADLRNYLVWEVQFDLQPRADAGDDVAAQRIPSRLGALRKLIEVWDDLHLP